MNTPEQKATSLVNHWYFVFLIGLVMAGLGLYLLFNPGVSLAMMTVMFGTGFIIAGILEVYFATANRDLMTGWGWNLMFGIVNFFVGVVLLTSPAVTTVVMLVMFAFIVIMRSAAMVAMAMSMREMKIPRTNLIILLGILGMIMGTVMLWDPEFAGMTMVFFLSWSLVIIGSLYCVSAFDLRRMKKSMTA